MEDSTETRPSFGPSFSKITECGHLKWVKVSGLATREGSYDMYFQVSISPGSYTAPQLKYRTPGTSGVSSLNFRMLSKVRHSKAFPSPPPFGRRSRRVSTEGIRVGPTVERKWSAKADPR